MSDEERIINSSAWYTVRCLADSGYWGVEWNVLKNNGADTSLDVHEEEGGLVHINPAQVSPGWSSSQRAIMIFDLSDILGKVALSARLDIMPYTGGDRLNLDPEPKLNLYSASPASYTAIEAADYNRIASTALCSNPISVSDWFASRENWYSFIINQQSLSLISGHSKLAIGLREVNYDVGTNEPVWSNPAGSPDVAFSYYTSTVGKTPRLVLTVSEGSIEGSKTQDFVTGIDIYVSPDKNTFLSELTLGGLEARWQPIDVGEPLPTMATIGKWIHIETKFEVTEEGYIQYEVYQDPEGHIVKIYPDFANPPPSGRGLGPRIKWD